jgi:glutamate-5-semialdehyde dehydrogenase
MNVALEKEEPAVTDISELMHELGRKAAAAAQVLALAPAKVKNAALAWAAAALRAQKAAILAADERD